MHDTLTYLGAPPIERKNHHNEILRYLIYAFSENNLLVLSHDEVVHLKRALLEKMPGDERQKFANLRLLLAIIFTMPGKKLLFMGGEIAQRREWSEDRSLDWDVLDFPAHRGVQELVKDLNLLYRREAAMHELDFDPSGFSWIDFDDREKSIISFVRTARGPPQEDLVFVFNFTPVFRHDYCIGMPSSGEWQEIMNTDASRYGGSNVVNFLPLITQPGRYHNRSFITALTSLC